MSPRSPRRAPSRPGATAPMPVAPMPVAPAPARSRLRRVLTGSAVLTLGGLASAPGLGLGGSAGAATTAPGLCTARQLSAGANLSGKQIAGYSLMGLAAGFRYEVDSPGLLPVGDPQQGNITELDVPFARETASEGLVASRSSAAYPGDTAAGIGSALGTFGLKGVPNDPVVASAAYPASPDSPASSTYPTSPEPSTANAGTARASADQNGGSSQSSVSSYSLASGASPVSSGGPSRSSSDVHVSGGCVDVTATATASDIVIAGLIHISGVTGTAAAMSDGAKAVPAAALNVGDVTVGGLRAFIDQNGIHLAGQQPVGQGVVAQVQAALNSALATDGASVKLLAPVSSAHGASATVDSGGLDVVVQKTLPATSVPGVPAVAVPGAPPVPLGTPGAPLRYEIVYGKAQATVDATAAPAPGSLVVGGSAGPGPASGPSAGAGSAGSGAGLSSGSSPAFGSAGFAGSAGSPGSSAGLDAGAAGPGTSRLSASGSPAPGHPAPLGWVIIGVLVSFLAAGPLLGYARWQLLEGRI